MINAVLTPNGANTSLHYKGLEIIIECSSYERTAAPGDDLDKVEISVKDGSKFVTSKFESLHSCEYTTKTLMLLMIEIDSVYP